MADAAVTTSSSTSAGAAGSRSLSLNPLRRALHGALLAREVANAVATTTTRALAAQASHFRTRQVDSFLH
jgi:hypothetical protein